MDNRQNTLQFELSWIESGCDNNINGHLYLELVEYLIHVGNGYTHSNIEYNSLSVMYV